LTVECEYYRGVILEIEPEDAGVRSVDEPQADALTAFHHEAVRHVAVDRDRVADATIMAHILAAAEIVADLGGRRQPPVIEHPGHVAVNARWFGFLYDERTIKAAPDLLKAPLMRVIPEGAGIYGIEFIKEPLTRRDRMLRQMRNTVHCVRQAQPVPVDGRLLGKPVLYRNAKAFALTDADLGTGDSSIIAPCGRLVVRLGNQPCAARRGFQAEFPYSACTGRR
jgi:hypothetical protein